jgi:hypothetical protein
MILSELARPGRADRVLIACPKHALEQTQRELWTRFALLVHAGRGGRSFTTCSAHQHGDGRTPPSNETEEVPRKGDARDDSG